MALLELHNIFKTYVQAGLEIPVLKDISCSIEEGNMLPLWDHLAQVSPH